MPKLAILGGKPIRTEPFPVYHSIGEEEKQAVLEALDGKVLSAFLGTWSDQFYGGARVQSLENAWSDYFDIKHAVSVNSATSGLYAAVGAAGISPGDEVIVAPYTMIASATAALVYGGIPVFSDIDEDIFCITPESIRERISPYTRAIIVVDLFGHPADMDEIMAIGRENDLVVIEDAAQAPGARYKGKNAGTLADIGVFSLNYHKTIHSGEGGMVVTNDDEFAERVRLIRNHAEVVVGNKGTENLVNMVGFNYRMTEIEATIAREQLKKLEKLLLPRIHAAKFLSERLGGLPGIQTPVTKPDIRHGYYLYSLRYDETVLGVPRDRFVEALNAEGIPMVSGYVKPIYLEPMYQNRIAFGRDGYPFSYPGYKGQVSYEQGICPVTERMYNQELMFTNICHAGIRNKDLDDFINGFYKVYENLDVLKG
jgi:dTDP-4-amino-4,6-dideoxygalactose transaminase